MKTKFRNSDLNAAARNLRKGNYHSLMLFEIAEMLEEYARIRREVDIDSMLGADGEKTLD